MTQLQELILDYGSLPDDDVYPIIGAALLGSGLNVSPADRSRLRRFARGWLDSKTDLVWTWIRGTETYRIWAATAGPGQAIEAGPLATMVHEYEPDDELAAALAVVLSRRQLAEAHEYDVAVSCAEAESGYVGQVVNAARKLGLTVFYAKDMTHAWWGRNFIVEGRRVYGQRTWHFVPFVSAEYLVEPRPRDAFEAAMLTAVHRGDDYILPVIVGDVTVPPELLNPAIGFLRAEDHSAPELAALLSVKVSQTKARGAGSRDLGAIVHDAHADPA